MLYDIHPLRPEERERAYALIRLIKPSVDVERWQEFLETTHGACAKPRRRGVVVASTPDGYLVGLFTWEVQASLDHGRVFAVDNLVATGVLDREPLLSATLAYIDEQAKDLSCGGVQIMLPSYYTGTSVLRSPQPMVDGFVEHGFSVVDQKLCKQCTIDEADSSPKRKRAGNNSPDALL